MRSSILALLATALLAVHAQDIQLNELPSQCRSVCRAATSVSVRCDHLGDNSRRLKRQLKRQDDNDNDDDNDDNDDNNDGDEADWIDCVCNSSDASNVFPNCEACVAQFDEDDNGEH
jgi:hypothetical protein